MEHNHEQSICQFGKMLSLTAEMFVEMEDTLFWQKHLMASDSLLDVGCGNASYLIELHSRYPQTSFTGIDADEGILRLARERAHSGIRLAHSRYEDYHPEHRYSAMLVRLVVQHIPNRQHFCAWMERYLEPGGLAFILDFADEKFEGDRLLPQFTALFRSMRAPLHKQRTFLTIQDAIRLEWTQRGFSLLEMQRYKISAHNAAMKQRMLAYMRLVTLQHGNAEQRKSILPELDDWGSNPQGAIELPMFGLVFQKQQGRC